MTDHRFCVLDAKDVIIQVGRALNETLGRFVGHSVWETMPRGELLLRSRFEEARRTGREVEFTTFYAGGTLRIRIVPSGKALIVYPTRLTELNVRTLGTLNASLRQILSELPSPGPARSDSQVAGSLQALP